jgi:transcriptional regulator, GntR family
MLITIDWQSEWPIYIQLRNQIIEGIASRQLKPGDPLPSIRSLAADLGINMHTINKAYQMLKQEGYIQIHRQKGILVNPDGMPKVTDDFLEQLDMQLRPLVSEAMCRGLDEDEFTARCKGIFRSILERSRD